jgi:hypothetical protein
MNRLLTTANDTRAHAPPISDFRFCVFSHVARIGGDVWRLRGFRTRDG